MKKQTAMRLFGESRRDAIAHDRKADRDYREATDPPALRAEIRTARVAARKRAKAA
jgi:hypothetical protein